MILGCFYQPENIVCLVFAKDLNIERLTIVTVEVTDVSTLQLLHLTNSQVEHPDMTTS